MIKIIHSATIVGLALRDFLHEWRLSVCAILGVAVVLAPLLVFFGLKHGIVTALIERLKLDPRNLELRIQGQGLYTAAWLAKLQARSDIAFVVPKTRFLASTLSLRNEHHQDRLITNAELVPTAMGDPLLLDQDTIPSGYQTIILSRSAAEKLDAAIGVELIGVVGRQVEEEHQTQRLNLQVAGILPAEYYQREAAFVSVPLLLATEQYREGFAVSDLGWTGRTLSAGPRTYASFRLYAKTIDDILSLRDWLAEEGVDSRIRAAEISAIKRLDSNLTILFLVLAVLSGSGFVFLMIISQWAAVIRKQRELSILRLLGFKTYAIALFPVIQAAAAALVGTSVAIGMYFLIKPVTNGLFSERLQLGDDVSQLLLIHIIFAVTVTLLCSVLAASVAAWRATRISPAEGLRDE